jgi:hypothetical protein
MRETSYFSINSCKLITAFTYRLSLLPKRKVCTKTATQRSEFCFPKINEAKLLGVLFPSNLHFDARINIILKVGPDISVLTFFESLEIKVYVPYMKILP